MGDKDVSAARSVAFDLLRAVLGRRTSFDEALVAHDGFRKLPVRDRGFARLIVATTLRRLGQIDVLLARFIPKPLPKSGEAVRDILRLASAEMLFLDVAHHAAVDSAVTLVTSRRLLKFKALTNAVLRRVSREGAAVLAEIPETAAIPDWMLAVWVETYGEKAAGQIAHALLKEPPLDISVKADAAGWAEKLGAVQLPGGTLRRSFAGPITGLPGFAEGAWWVQDAAASLPVPLLGPVSGKRVLDLCAAPGGKTAQLIAGGGLVTALDRSEARMQRLTRNLSRLAMACEVVVADAAEWRTETPFQAVLVDPPCTATGVIRRHPDILHARRPEELAKLTALQDRLLAAAVANAAPGAPIVYCTCSLQPEEGEARIQALLNSGAPVRHDAIRAEEIGGYDFAITESGQLRTLPHHLAEAGGLDGFFAARLIKL